MKREDLSGFAMGGNKVRKFEFFMADALQHKADCLVAIGAVQSNHTRIAATCGLSCGLEPYLLLMGEQPNELRGNLLLEHILGAEIEYIPKLFSFEERLQAMCGLTRRLKRKGRKPYVLPVSDPLGCFGPLQAMEETLQQANLMDVDFDCQVVPVGSGETLLGLAMGVVLKGSHCETLGMCIGRGKGDMASLLNTLAVQLPDLIAGDVMPSDMRYSLLDDYLGVAGEPTPEGLAAIELVGRAEGIFLDPIYTGKAMAGMLDLIRHGRFSSSQNVLFWNTSSAPIFFAYDTYVKTRDE
jgi:1-aminocyclopropane-1-carboxylate deaminase/D-cysteine desulfhydrase-like pyridoxal-dependent ACC family enzyme